MQVRPETVNTAKVPPLARASAAIALLASLALVWQAMDLLQRDLVFNVAETEVSFWGRGEYLPYEHTREATGRAVEHLVDASPAHPDYLTLAASHYAWRAWWAQETAVENAYNARALAAQYAAQQSRPAYRQGWESVLRYAARVDEADAKLALAQRRLDALHP